MLLRSLPPAHSPHAAADSQYLIALISLQQGKAEKALLATEEGMEYALASGDSRRLCFMHLLQTEAMFYLAHPETAMHHAQEAKSLAHSISDYPASLQSYYLMGRIALRYYQAHVALEHFQTALSFLHYYSDDKKRGDIVLGICSCYYRAHDLARTIVQALDCLDTTHNYHTIIEKEKQTLAVEQEVEQEVLQEVEQELEQKNEGGSLVYGGGEYLRVPLRNDAVFAQASYYAGLSYGRLGEKDSAIHYLLQSLDTYNKLEALSNVAEVARDVGRIYRDSNELNNAATYFEQSKKLYRETRQQNNAFLLHIDVAHIALKQSDWQQATTLIDEAEMYFTEVGDWQQVQQCRFQRALIAMARGEYDTSILLLNDVLKQSEKLSPLFCFQLWYELGSCYKQLHKHDEALRHLHKALDYAEKLSQTEKLNNENVQVLYTLSSVYKQMQNYEQALAYHKQYESLKYQLFAQQSKLREEQLEIIHQLEKHQQNAEKSRETLFHAQQQVQHKDRELSDFALRIVEKQELLEMIERGVEGLMQATQDQRSPKLLSLLRSVKREAAMVEEDWNSFQSQFEGMQQDFIQVLSRKYPSLSPTELKVCMLLRMRVSTKQIADIMRISPKAVENHRVSVRRKMGLDRSTDLVTTLLGTEEKKA